MDDSLGGSVSLRWGKIPEGVKAPTEALLKLLASATILVENSIIKSLHSEPGLRLEVEEVYGFSDIDGLRKNVKERGLTRES